MVANDQCRPGGAAARERMRRTSASGPPFTARLSGLHESADLENFSAELADRFGPLPEEVKHLLTVVQIKNYCRRARHFAGGCGAEGRGYDLPQ